jgi:hypothetical protein
MAAEGVEGGRGVASWEGGLIEGGRTAAGVGAACFRRGPGRVWLARLAAYASQFVCGAAPPHGCAAA